MRNNGIQLRIADLLYAFHKHWKIIAALTLAGLLAGMLLTGMARMKSAAPTYDVSGSFAVTASNEEGRLFYAPDYSWQKETDYLRLMADAVIYVLNSDDTLNWVIDRGELSDVTADRIRSALNISRYNDTRILEMTLSWNDREEGMYIWNTIVEVANEKLPEKLKAGHLEVINGCSTRLKEAEKKGIRAWVVLAVLGFCAGTGFAVLEILIHPTLIIAGDIETLFGQENIGVIPEDGDCFRSGGPLFSSGEAVSSPVVQYYSAAAHILSSRMGPRGGSHCFYITSAVRGEGRSTAAASLALQFSGMERRTLLIDLDTQSPGLGTLLMGSVDSGRSLNAFCRRKIGGEEAITSLTEYLDILPVAAEQPALPVNRRLIDLVHSLKEKYEYVILDAPPVGRDAETLRLNEAADTVVFVAGYDQAELSEIQSALERLDRSGMSVAGCIVNRVRSSRFR